MVETVIEQLHDTDFSKSNSIFHLVM